MSGILGAMVKRFAKKKLGECRSNAEGAWEQAKLWG
jgi:hypothetical protein